MVMPYLPEYNLLISSRSCLLRLSNNTAGGTLVLRFTNTVPYTIKTKAFSRRDRDRTTRSPSFLILQFFRCILQMAVQIHQHSKALIYLLKLRHIICQYIFNVAF